MFAIHPRSRATYRILLALLAMGTFGLFSDIDVHFFAKGLGMLIVLQAGFALLYFGVYRKHRWQK